MYTREQAAARRDQKVGDALREIAPIWLINDTYRPDEESLLFDLVYLHSEYGWVQQRFKYDAFNNVLYHMGILRLTEVKALEVQERDPYLAGEVATAVPVHPVNRISPPLPATPRGN
jgi:hypothetical protein